MAKNATINSLDDAIAFLGKALEDDAPDGWPDEIVFGDLLAKIEIDIDGAKYHATVPAELARALWEYQEALYKAAAFALYRVEDGRKLTRDQRDRLELVFEVRQGSTGLVASLKDFMVALAKGFETMDSKHKALTLVAVVIVLATGYGASLLVESGKQIEVEAIKARQASALESEKTKQFELIARAAGSADGIVDKFSKASEKGARAIVEAAADADTIRIGRANLDKGDIEDVNQRATRERATPKLLIEEFLVLRVEPKDEKLTRFQLQRTSTGADFVAILQDDELDPRDVQQIWDAARSRKAIQLEVAVTMMRGSVRSAHILGAIEPSRLNVATR